MKKMLFLILSAWFPFLMSAQVPSERPWGSGPLSWDEFRMAGPDDEGQSRCQIVWREGKTRLNRDGVRYQYTDVHSWFNSDFSYVREGCRNPAQLRLNQGIFNISEKYALCFRDSLILCTSGKDSLRSRIWRLCQEETESWKRQWESDTDSPLPCVPADGNIALPAFRSDTESYLGIGYVGKLVRINSSRTMVYAPGLTFGMRFNRHYIELEGNMTAMGGRYSRSSDRYIADYIGVTFRYGFNIISACDFRASLFMGGGGAFMRLYNPARDRYFDFGSASGKTKFGVLSPQAVGGVAFEYDIARFAALNDTRYDFSRASLFLKVYADKMYLVYSSNRNAVRLITSVSAGVKISRSFNKRKP